MGSESATADLNSQLHLPLSLVGPVDIGRLIRELESVDTQLTEQALRSRSAVAVDSSIPALSVLASGLVTANQIDISNLASRQALIVALNELKTSAPRLHISFSVQPSDVFLQNLLTYLRREIDPAVLVSVGRQPNIGAGCLVRTTNKQFDLSLRQRFASNRELLMATLHGKAPA